MYAEHEGVGESVDEHLENVPFPHIFKMRVGLKDVYFLEEERSDSQNNDKEYPPDVLKFLSWFENFKKKIPVEISVGGSLPFWRRRWAVHVRY